MCQAQKAIQQKAPRGTEDMLTFQVKGYTLLAVVVSVPAIVTDFLNWILK